MKILIIVTLMLILASCKSKDNLKSVSVFIDPSQGYDVPVKHVRVFLDDVQIADKSVLKGDVSTSLLIKCVSIDSTKNHAIVVKINDKSISINPANYHSKCIAIFTGYDTNIKIRESFRLFEKRSILKTGVIPNYNKFIDSIKLTNTKSKYDSITYGVQLNKCWCDSAGHGYGY
ncbi:hypothetical protein KXQ82_05795 [Mucilaginibacter sp. HMF5004]|uniref:hypothetical protein n=1 Tax=Mucilaginibacter rivuli TaxID=2857527 RepID=UPI001C5E7DCE|nr:hypothetical protein [Mucilaginibacter rivuli]MBW4889216.1 hypothetical protein [Mucilaginibacter rivuli]